MIMRVPVGLDCVDVCLERARMVVLVFRRRVWAVLATRFIVGVQKVAVRGGLPNMAAISLGEGVL